MGTIFTVGLFVFLLLLGLVVGGMTERNHFRRLREREVQTQDILVTQIRSFPAYAAVGPPPTMLVAEVVISSDYLKSFLARLRKIFGGEIRSVGTLLERARREVLLRIKEQARDQGYNAVCNVRLETADISGRGSNSKNKVIMAALLASATAYNTADQ